MFVMEGLILIFVVTVLICGIVQFITNKNENEAPQDMQDIYNKKSEALNDEAIKLSKTLFFEKLLQSIKQSALKKAQSYIKSYDNPYAAWINSFSIYAYERYCIIENDYDGPNLSVDYKDLNIGIEEITEHDAKVLQRTLYNTGLFVCCSDYGELKFKYGLFKEDFNLIQNKYKKEQEQLHNNLYK